jgi:hypothetical protein
VHLTARAGWLPPSQVWGAEEAIGELVKVEGAYSKPEAVRTDQRTPYLITRLTSPVCPYHPPNIAGVTDGGGGRPTHAPGASRKPRPTPPTPTVRTAALPGPFSAAVLCILCTVSEAPCNPILILQLYRLRMAVCDSAVGVRIYCC